MNWAAIEPWPSHDFAWPPFQEARSHISDAEIGRIKAAGFDFVRLTVDPGLLIWAYGNAHADDMDDRLRTQVRRYLSTGLKVIVDPHPVDQHEDYPTTAFVKGVGSPGFEAYAAMMARLARTVAKMGSAVALELMNEPPIDTPLWQPMAVRLHQLVRASAGPGLTIIVPGARFGAPEGLTALDPTPFLNSEVIFTFHDYVPFTFTHQGVLGTRNVHLSKIPWPVDPSAGPAIDAAIKASVSSDGTVERPDKPNAYKTARAISDAYLASKAGFEETDAIFESVVNWARGYRIPHDRILLGEFGVARTSSGAVHAPEADRLAWLNAMRTDAEKRGFPWAVWAYRGPGGMALAQEGPDPQLDPASLLALGLHPPAG
jgi:hypothetical protein